MFAEDIGHPLQGSILLAGRCLYSLQKMIFCEGSCIVLEMVKFLFPIEFSQICLLFFFFLLNIYNLNFTMSFHFPLAATMQQYVHWLQHVPLIDYSDFSLAFHKYFILVAMLQVYAVMCR